MEVMSDISDDPEMENISEARIVKKQTRTDNHTYTDPPVNLTEEELQNLEDLSEIVKSKDEDNFPQAVRMSMNHFNLLLSLLEDSLRRFSRRKPVVPEKRLAITLFYLAQGCSAKFLAWSNKMGVSTIRKVVYETCDSIWEELKDLIVAPPDCHEWEAIAHKFYTSTGIPNCLGAIDAKQITIAPRRDDCAKDSHAHQKRKFTTILVGACDCNYSFTFVDIVAPSKLETDESDVLERSTFGQALLDNKLRMPADKPLPGTTVAFPYYFVVDNKFPLKDNLLRPYPGYDISEDKQHFNNIFAKTQEYSENTFGVLANQWRILLAPISGSPQNINKVILATIALHNFLLHEKDSNYFTPESVDSIRQGIQYPGSWRNEKTSLRPYNIAPSKFSTASALELRNYLKDYLLFK